MSALYVFILYFFLLVMALIRSNSVRASVYGFGLPPKPCNATVLQSGFTDVVSSILDLPMEIRVAILDQLNASSPHLKSHAKSIICDIFDLDSSFAKLEMQREMRDQGNHGPGWEKISEICDKNRERHIAQQEYVSNSISDLINKNCWYESITKDHSPVQNHINEINSERMSDRGHKVSSIKDMTTILNNYNKYFKKK